MVRIIFIALLLSIAHVAIAKNSGLVALKKELTEQQQARNRWQNLASDLKNEKKAYDPKKYMGKDVLLNGATVKFDGKWLELECGQTGSQPINCFVLPPKDWIDPGHPIHADTNVLEVFGSVIGIKPGSMRVSIKAESIKVGASE